MSFCSRDCPTKTPKRAKDFSFVLSIHCRTKDGRSRLWIKSRFIAMRPAQLRTVKPLDSVKFGFFSPFQLSDNRFSSTLMEIAEGFADGLRGLMKNRLVSLEIALAHVAVIFYFKTGAVSFWKRMKSPTPMPTRWRTQWKQTHMCF